MKTSDIRREYQYTELHRRDLAKKPLVQFAKWLEEATQHEAIPDPTAMVLATVNAQGQPAQRTVLLKNYDDAGFTFFTNLQSHKSEDMVANAKVSLLFQWLPQSRQAIIQGTVQRTTRTEDEAYFASRPRASQLAAWASAQSHALSNREQLENGYAEIEKRFGDAVIPCPENWGGWRVIPTRIEFWQGRPCRLHDRFVYEQLGNRWQIQRLAP